MPGECIRKPPSTIDHFKRVLFKRLCGRINFMFERIEVEEPFLTAPLPIWRRGVFATKWIVTYENYNAKDNIN